MPLAKAHCCNAFGWLYVDAESQRQAMAAQLNFRDHELAADKNASGEPRDFEAWAIRQVRGLAQQPEVARQIEQRRATLLRQLDRLDSEAAQQALAHDRAVAAVERDLALLDEVSPAPVTIFEAASDPC